MTDPTQPIQPPAMPTPPVDIPPPTISTAQPGMTPEGPPPGWTPPPPNRGPLVLVVVLVLVGLIAVALLLSGTGGLGRLFGGTNISDVSVGQCFNGARAGATAASVSEVDIVDCSQAHTSELIASFDYPSLDAYPGIDTVRSYASDQCLSQFADYVGKTFSESTLDMTYVYPYQETWDQGDRSIQCIVHPPAGTETSTGSYRGSGL